MSPPSEQPPTRAGSLPLVGGVLALDFCNTASGRGTPGQLEHLRTAGDIIAWGRHAAVLDTRTAAELRRRCDGDAAFGGHLLRTAIRLRDAIYRIDADLARGRPPDQADVDVIAATHAACLAKGRLTSVAGGFRWSWTVEETPAEAILGPIAASAMTVITAADRGRLKQCDGHQCGWLFLDTTKSGNRAKQKRRRGRPPQD